MNLLELVKATNVELNFAEVEDPKALNSTSNPEVISTS